MNFTLGAILTCLALMGGMLLALEAGRRLARRRHERHPETAKAGLGTLEGAIFGLLGLVVAFTFSGAGSRLDVRRQLVAQEANAIGTAYLRLDLLPSQDQVRLKPLFRTYLDARLASYRQPFDSPGRQAAMNAATRLQGEIWTQALAACDRDPRPQTTQMVVPALNDMIDVTTTRAMATRIHPPPVIFAMLFILAIAGALVAGYGSGEDRVRSWLHYLVFAAIFAGTIYVIVDLEYPRLGLIRVDATDQVLDELRAQMK